MTTKRIELGHGGGGRLTHDLVGQLFKTFFSNAYLDPLGDAAVLPGPMGRLAMTTDSYVIRPVFFPGGDIGRLAVCGTVNDLSMVGAKPLYLTAGFILEEGFPVADLERIVASMSETAKQADVMIVAGDTKVVERGSADQIFINTAGVGVIPGGLDLSPRQIRPGDRILVSGSVGDHGIAVLSRREGLEMGTSLISDCAPLNGLVRTLLERHHTIRAMRDPTRGGMATTLIELALQSRLGFVIEETETPIRDEVQAVCELLGMDPFYVANEGKLIAVVSASEAESVLHTLRSHPLGREARLIGEVVEAHPKKVILRTCLGVGRILQMAVTDQLPRIC